MQGFQSSVCGAAALPLAECGIDLSTTDADADADADGDTVEAADGDWPGAILCGSAMCSGGGKSCCVLEGPPVTQACETETPPGDECATGFEVCCDGPEDCGPVTTGGYCCVSYCLRSACPAGQMARHEDTDCPSGQHCCTATMRGCTFKACRTTACP